MLKLTRPALGLLAAATMLAGAALAQTKGANGGPVVKADGHPIEFVSSGQEITFYVSDDDGSPMSMRSATATRAVVQDGGKTSTVQLAPADPNRLIGKLAAPLSTGARVVFSARMHGHSMQARFVMR